LGRLRCSWLNLLHTTLLIFLLNICSGCRTTEGNFSRIINEPAPVPENVRTGFGRMGVLLTSENPEFNFNPPATPVEAAIPIAEKTYNSVHRSTRPDKNSDLDDYYKESAASLAFSVIAAGVVGVVGSYVVGVPEDEIKDAEATLRKALHNHPLESLIQSRVLQMAARQPIPHLSSVTMKVNSRNPTTNDLQALSVLGLDSLLIIRVGQQRFEELSGLNPPMTFAVAVEVEVKRVSDGARLHKGYLEYRGRRLKFTEWAERKAKPFRSEMERVTRTMTSVIVDQLLVPSSTAGK
jgi:hypothetical protein